MIIIMWLIYAVLIAAHELGHYLAAQQMGLTVEKMVIGIPTVYKREWRGIEVCIGLLPLVGYVTPDADEYEDLSGAEKVWLYLSGPTASIVTAYLLMVLGGADIAGSILQCLSTAVEVMVKMLTHPSVIVVGGSGNMLVDMGLMSASLAGLNMLPIPPLDGGSAIFAYLEERFGDNLVVYTTEEGEEVNLIMIARSLLSLAAVALVAYILISSIKGG